jgi:signal transduction histidine kinase
MIGVLFGDFSGRITEANDYVLSLLRYTRTDLESGAIRWTDLTPAEWKAADANALEELRASRVCRPYEKQYIRKGGARVPILIGAAVLEGSEEETISFVLDMAERERLLLEERQARGDAEKALRAREEFIALAAHELRTPLTPLKLQLRMLATQLAEGAGMATATRPVKQLVGLFESADRQVDRLSRLVEDLLDASALKTWRLEPSTVDLAELAREVVERYRSAWTAAGSTVEVHAEAPVIGLFDRRRIEQVVVNLLTNAIKYGRGRPIAVTVREDSGHAMLSVRDLGIGIATEDQQRIFERFERAVGVEHFGGFGLGLHISREIVRAHGGDIRVESRLDEDACFTVDLPCRRGRS